MAPGNGWYLIGPLIAVGLVGFLGAVFWRMGLQWTLAHEPDIPREPYPDGLAIFGTAEGDGDDYGLLGTAAVAEAPEVADDIRRLLGDFGIRATQAIGRDGRTAVLVFPEELEEARRLVGDTPAL
jgi:hypothetical protein